MQWMYPIFILLFVFLIFSNREKNTVIAHKIHKNKKGAFKMTDLINDYIGKECLIYTCMSSSQITGTICSCKDGWLVVENANGQRDIVNCEYVTRIREYPRDKKGKKKSVVFD